MKFTSRQLTFIILSAILLFSFTGFDRETSISKKNSVSEIDSLVTSDYNKQWQQKVNSGAENLGQLYTENAIKVHTDGKLSEGRGKISKYYKDNPHQIESITTVKSIIAVLDSTTVYEIGRFATADQKELAHLILWREENGKLLREVELVAPLEETGHFKSEIDQRRTEWMTLCNAHNAKDLVANIYSENALYYNHRPMIVGQEAIVTEYGYMNNPNYRLNLTPIIFKTINESLVFEIGQCSGSYPGNYVLVWQKNESGDWRIFFDSNI